MKNKIILIIISFSINCGFLGGNIFSKTKEASIVKKLQNADLENADYYFYLTKKIKKRAEKISPKLFLRLNLNSKKGSDLMQYKSIKLTEKEINYIFEPIKADTNVINCIVELTSNSLRTKIKYRPEFDTKDEGNDIRYFEDIETRNKKVKDHCYMIKRSIGKISQNDEVIDNVFKVNERVCLDGDKKLIIYLSGRKSELVKTYKKKLKY